MAASEGEKEEEEFVPGSAGMEGARPAAAAEAWATKAAALRSSAITG